MQEREVETRLMDLCVFLRYVVSSLELLVAEDYMIVYLNGATPRRKMPGIVWLKRCYQMIDRKWEWNNSPNISCCSCKWITSTRLLQTEEESQVSHHRSPHVVHQDRFGHLEAIYQVISANYMVAKHLSAAFSTKPSKKYHEKEA